MMGEHEVRLDGVVFLEGDAPGPSAADTSALALGAAQNWAPQRAAPDERLSRHRMRRLTGRHALVQLLLPVLVQSASTSTSPLRIISTVSPLYAIAAAQPTKFRPDDLDYTLKPADGGDAQQQQRYPSGAPWEAEGRIALAAVLLWRELQARLASLATAKPGPTSTSSTTTSAAPILAVSVCPGLTRASLFATLAPSVRRAPLRLALAIVCAPLVWLLAKSADEAAQGVLGALLGPVEGESEAVRAAKGPEGAAVEKDEVKGGRKEVDSREGKRRMRVRGGALYREGREVRCVLCSLTLRRRRARPLELTEPLLRPQHRRSRRAPARGRRRPVGQRVQARRAAPRRCGRGAEARGPGQGGGQGASEGRGPGAAGRGEEGHLERSVATVPWTLCFGLDAFSCLSRRSACFAAVVVDGYCATSASTTAETFFASSPAHAPRSFVRLAPGSFSASFSSHSLDAVLEQGSAGHDARSCQVGASRPPRRRRNRIVVARTSSAGLITRLGDLLTRHSPKSAHKHRATRQGGRQLGRRPCRSSSRRLSARRADLVIDPLLHPRPRRQAFDLIVLTRRLADLALAAHDRGGRLQGGRAGPRRRRRGGLDGDEIGDDDELEDAGRQRYERRGERRRGEGAQVGRCVVLSLMFLRLHCFEQNTGCWTSAGSSLTQSYLQAGRRRPRPSG